MTQGQTKEFQDPDLVTQQEPFETVQLPQMCTYSVIQQFAICPYDFDDALLHQLEPDEHEGTLLVPDLETVALKTQ